MSSEEDHLALSWKIGVGGRVQNRKQKAFLGLSGITRGDCKTSKRGKSVVYCSWSRKEEEARSSER